MTGNGYWKQYGKIVVVFFDSLTLKSNISDSGNGYYLFSGLPRAYSDAIDIRFANGRLIGVWYNSTFNFRTWWDNYTQGDYHGFTFTYIAA